MKRRMRNKRGAHIAEFAAALTFGLPLLALLVFVGMECAQYYTIRSAMEVGARAAARGLVVRYNKTGVKNTSVDWVTTPHFIANSSQFTTSWDASTPPSYVTVKCTYPSGGAYGLPVFPAGPLKYLSTNANFSLQSVGVHGTFTLPIQ